MRVGCAGGLADVTNRRDLMAVTNDDIFAAVLSLREATDAFSQRTDLRFDRLEVRMDRIEVRMDKLEVRMDRLEGRMGRVETRVESLEDGQRGIRSDLDDLKRRFC